MSFRALGINFLISVPFAVMLSFLLIMDKTGLMSASLFAVLLHEAGHLVAMKSVGCAPKSVKLRSAGITISGNAYCTRAENLVISLAGPVANLLVFGILYIIGICTDNIGFFVYAAVQFIVGTLNLLPIKGLDGGSILYLLLLNIKKINAGFVCTFISLVTAVAVSVLGAAVAVNNIGNPSLLLLGIYLIILNLIKR